MRCKICKEEKEEKSFYTGNKGCISCVRLKPSKASIERRKKTVENKPRVKMYEDYLQEEKDKGARDWLLKRKP